MEPLNYQTPGPSRWRYPRRWNALFLLVVVISCGHFLGSYMIATDARNPVFWIDQGPSAPVMTTFVERYDWPLAHLIYYGDHRVGEVDFKFKAVAALSACAWGLAGGDAMYMPFMVYRRVKAASAGRSLKR